MSDWTPLFRAAFKQSRNAMVLVGEDRSLLDVNGAFLQLTGYKRATIVGNPVYTLVDGGPRMTAAQWAAALVQEHFTGEIGLICADGTILVNQWGAHTAGHTGKRLVLLVMLPQSRWGGRVRPELPPGHEPSELTEREREIVRLIALGKSGPEIAEDLGISHDTVRTHVRNAMHKVGARSRAHLVAKSLGEGHALR